MLISKCGDETDCAMLEAAKVARNVPHAKKLRYTSLCRQMLTPHLVDYADNTKYFSTPHAIATVCICS